MPMTAVASINIQSKIVTTFSVKCIVDSLAGKGGGNICCWCCGGIGGDEPAGCGGK